jgi:hypothetical protein
MARNRKKELMMISFDKASELYLSTLATEGKSPRYVDWLKTRLRYFGDFLTRTHGSDFILQNLTVEDGRMYIRDLMGRDTRYIDHPMHKAQRGKLKIQYIHGLGRAVRSFSTWAGEEGYLDENVLRRLKLPQLPNHSRDGREAFSKSEAESRHRQASPARLPAYVCRALSGSWRRRLQPAKDFGAYLIGDDPQVCQPCIRGCEGRTQVLQSHGQSGVQGKGKRATEVKMSEIVP